MPTPFHIRLATPSDIPALSSLITRSFAHFAAEQLLGNINTPSALEAASARHLRAWEDHRAEIGRDSGVMCLAKDPSTGEEVLAAGAYWYFYPSPRTREKMEEVEFLFSGSWLDSPADREKAVSHIQPVVDVRKKWMGNRGYAALVYMATDPAWRRQGAASAVVQWGLERCEELGIPAILEASEEGAPVYERLGFERVDEVVIWVEGVRTAFPSMVWWPPSMGEKERRPMGW